MKTQTIAVVAGVVVVALVAAYQFFPRTGHQQCDDDYATYCSSGTCELTVTLDACLPSAVHVVPDTLHVCNNNQPLNWTIKTVGYVFDSPSGIDFKGNKDFDKETPNGASYSWRDKHGKKDPDIEYGFRILKDGGGPCTRSDPRISND
ncbi:MAG TPA: hypothetical protein VH041_03010 [Caldimonas sp.]|nr:hypothetical protein [Caldimonas sp.]HEX4233249.1 hypothetical protein [Caldimonas sp.]